MDYSRLNKSEIEEIMEDRKFRLDRLRQEKNGDGSYTLPNDVINSLKSGGCRLCVWRTVPRTIQQWNPDTQEYVPKRVAAAIGQPYTLSRATVDGQQAREACRTCKHVREAMVEAGYPEGDMYI